MTAHLPYVERERLHAEIERLRAEVLRWAEYESDEIKRLHAEILRLRAELETQRKPQMSAVTEMLKAEVKVERLRAENKELLAAAKAFDADLSSYCDGPPRDALRAAIAKAEGREP